MWTRLAFLLVTVFFITMNVLLWRAEFGGRSQLASAVPAEMIWQKILTAPDISSLEIRHRGAKVGYCRWIPSIGDDLAHGRRMTDEMPEGMVRELISYNVDLNGSVSLDAATRLRFNLDAKLMTNHSWQELVLRLNLRPNTWEIHSVLEEQRLVLKTDDGDHRTERVFKFSDLQNPTKLLRELGGPVLPVALGTFGLPLDLSKMSSAGLGLTWEARNDWLKIGNSRLRVYRLQARVLDRFQAVFFISPVGEILRAELPGEVVLINDVLTSL